MFEQNLQNALFQRNVEKSFLDKLFSRQDVERVKELTRKSKLNREDLLELLYMLTSNEMKMINLTEWDRYIILKFFVWIREFVKVAEVNYDIQDDLKNKENTCSTCNKQIKTTEEKLKCKCKEPIPVIVLSKRAKKTLYNIERLIEHNVKFLTDLYFNIARTSLSLGATGFLEPLKQKFEMSYPYGVPNTNTQTENKTGGIVKK